MSGIEGFGFFGGGGVAISAGTQSQNTGSVLFSNQNGVTFGLSTAPNAVGTVTATVNPGPAAGIAGNIAGTQTQTSGSLSFANSNGISFGLSNSSVLTAIAAQQSVNVSAGTTSGNLASIAFSNLNGVSFGLNGATVTGSVAAQTAQSVGVYAVGNTTAQSSSSTVDARSLSFQGAQGVSVGMSNGSVVISGATGGGGGANFSAGVSTGGNTSGNTGITGSQLVLAGGNNITLSQVTGANGATVTVSGANIPAQTNQTLGLYASSNTTGQSSSTTIDARSLTVQGLGAASVGYSNGTLQISVAAGAQSNQSVGVYASSNTTGQSSSSTYDARSLSIVGAGIISVGNSNGAVLISAPGTTGLTQMSVGISGGNTSGNTGTVAQGQIVFAGGNNVTLSGSMNGSSMTVTISAFNQTNQTVGVYASSNTIGQSSSSTYDARSLSLVGQGIVSLGWSNSSLLVSASQSNQTEGRYAVGNTTGQSSSSTFDARTLSISGAGNISVGYSGNALVISQTGGGGGGFTGGVSTGGNTSGNTGTQTGQFVLAGGNNITLSVGTAAGGAQTITVSAFNQSNQSLGLYGVGNTTQNSSTTLDARTVSFDGLGALTVGFSNGSVQLSAPATSSLSATGLASISVNGSTISIGAAIAQLSFFQPIPSVNTTLTQLGAGTVQVYPAPQAFPFTATRADIFASVSVSTIALSSGAVALSLYVGLYSLNGSTLSLASSGSQSYQWTNSSNNSAASISGMRRFSAPVNVNYTGGFDLFIGVMSNTTFTNTNAQSISNVVVPVGPGPQLQGLIGQVPNNSMQFAPGQGIFSASSSALPGSIALSAISGMGSGGNLVDNYCPVVFANVTA